MPLRNDFFSLLTMKSEDETLKAEILINAQHQILKGHFPDQPVVPGVCMVQIVKELLEERLGNNYRLVKADHLKFLNLIDPRITPGFMVELKFEIIDLNTVKANAGFYNGDIQYFKLQGGWFHKKD